MTRMTWFAAGALAGAYGLVKMRRTARNLTPDGLAARAAALGAGMRVITTEVSTGMAEREGQLRDQLRDPTALEPGKDDVPFLTENAAPPRHRATQPRTEPNTDGHR